MILIIIITLLTIGLTLLHLIVLSHAAVIQSNKITNHWIELCILLIIVYGLLTSGLVLLIEYILTR